MSDEPSLLQELEGVVLLFFLFFSLLFFFSSFFSHFQEHPGKSFRVLYFHLSPGLLWTVEVIVQVNFRDLKGSNLKAFDWKCKLQLESSQVLRRDVAGCCSRRNPCSGDNLITWLPSTASEASKSITASAAPQWHCRSFQSVNWCIWLCDLTKDICGSLWQRMKKLSLSFFFSMLW